MSRTPIKTISNEIIEFIPPEHKAFDPKAEKIADRPLIFGGKRLTRDQRYALQEFIKIDYPEGVNPKDMVKEDFDKLVKISGKGDAFRFVWDTCVHYAKNVIIEENGKVEEFEEFRDMKKLWNTTGIDSEVFQTVNFFMSQSEMTESEQKN